MPDITKITEKKFDPNSLPGARTKSILDSATILLLKPFKTFTPGQEELLLMLSGVNSLVEALRDRTEPFSAWVTFGGMFCLGGRIFEPCLMG